jgi:SPP1 gp7 family putative phage head morphogenesis protein
MPVRAFSPRLRIESEYKRLIYRLVSRYLDLPEAANLGELTAALVQWTTLQNFFEQAATSIASRMATAIKVENARSWRAAAREGSRGREIYESLQAEMEGDIGEKVREIILQNAQLISSIPEGIREQVNKEIASMTLQGLRHEAIAVYLQKRIPTLTQSRAALIARTETSKSETALTKVRAEDLGLTSCQWQTSKDARVRPSHRNLDKVLMRFDDPPQPEALIGERSTLNRGLPGEFPNCRCVALPVLNLDDVSWPARVYSGGRIQRMTRANFRKFAA